ncbi:hypothetical protein B0O99DRAFT_300172 [Bisporella sp. PMI_857]|nr:hypothetical protein B0O99DRAFT_300172 [Bisporella sp. PMI_857]
MPRRLSEWFHQRSKNRSDVDPAASSATNITPDSSRTAALQKKTFPSGIKLLYNPEHSVVDIILVHGLTGDYEKTWTAKNAATPWPQSMLPSKIPNARILTFGYDAYIADWRGMVSRNRIGNHSMNLLTSVATFRENDDTNNCPIIFICHSLGG